MSFVCLVKIVVGFIYKMKEISMRSMWVNQGALSLYDFDMKQIFLL